jgi:hypothetical protein
MATANMILHTPWDCRWSRFARRTTAKETSKGLWECVHGGEPVAVSDADCENCPFWEYQAPAEGFADRTQASERSLATDRAVQRLDTGIRLSLFVIAVIFAACGFILLTGPLAVPLTISMWFGAAAALMLGIFGNFRSQADGSFPGLLPPRA